MNLHLSRPLVFFDLETTGINPAKDRIVQISLLKVYPDGKEELNTFLVNPQMPIPPQASAVHGITDEDVKNAPTFSEIAGDIITIIKDADIAGFNSNRFDVPMLAEELLRVGATDFDFTKTRFIDVQVIYHKKEPRTLAAAYKFYTGNELQEAHSADADTIATYEVLKAQLDKYDDLTNTVEFLSEFSTQKKSVDMAGFIVYDDNGREIFTFGKYKGQPVEDVMKRDSGYYGWIQNADFPLYTKKVLSEIYQRKNQ